MSISLLLITSVVFSATFLPLYFSADQQYEKCLSPLRCGSGSAVFPNITYPFWGTEIEKPNYCGLSPFKLSCEDNQNLTLDIGNLTLGVVSANLDNKAITVADESLFKGSGCPKILNFNENDHFSLSHNTETIDLFINCSGGSQIRSLSSISCQPSYNSTNTTYHVFGTSVPGRGCIKVGEIPMGSFAKNDLHQSKLTLNMALKQGFELKYNVPDNNCRDCTNSRGICGSEPGSENFRCLCEDKPHNFSCSVNGDQAGSSRTKIIVGTTASLSIFLILVVAAFLFWRYRAKHNEPTPVVIDTSQDVWENDFEPQDVSGITFFEMHTIRTATNNFSSSNKLGQGGFGPVYKGKLPDGKEIAVKRLSSSSGQGTNEFMNEIRLISKLQHRNLVRLLGYCIKEEEKLLIYEFMVNKSLDVFLYDSILKFELDWPKRFDIIEGIARGLLYLHRDSRLRVIHRDLKVSNILLDERMNPKISDFGLARMFQGTQYQENTRRVVGTLGYMSPEYALAGLFSEKSDIYSFGVLMLEIISGKRISRFSFGDEGKCLLAYAWDSWRETGGSNLLDRDLTDSSCQAFEVARCVQIGLLCVQHEAVDRPNTLQLLSMITSTTDLPIPKQPLFAVQTLNNESQPKDLFSVNEITQSEMQGR